jgi:L-ascorbate metabolism protein UlaG (beta-lactamase superfamily)
MQISYFGLTSFKITSKDKTIITDPFDKSTGLNPPRGNADILILSEKDNPTYSYTQSISGEPFIVDGPGEYDIKEISINAGPVKLKSGEVQTVYLMEVEGITILDLGHIKKFDFTEEELEGFGNIDVLLIPIGGHSAMDYEDAAKATNLLEPKFVIPTHYKIAGLSIEADTEEKFIKEIGAGTAERMEKLVLKKKELPEEGTKLVILEPLR